MTFPEITLYNFLLEMSTSVQAMKLKFGRNKFHERKEWNLQTNIRFWKESRDQVDGIIDQLHLSTSIPIVSFNFVSYQEICK